MHIRTYNLDCFKNKIVNLKGRFIFPTHFSYKNLKKNGPQRAFIFLEYKDFKLLKLRKKN